MGYFGSSEYLTLGFLASDWKKKSYQLTVDTIFRNENTDSVASATDVSRPASVSVLGRNDITDIKDLYRAFEDQNDRYSGPGHKSALSRIVFGYGWAAERTHFYNSVATKFGADTYLAPLRDAFCEGCLRLDGKSEVESLIENIKGRASNAIATIVEPSGRAKFAARLPFFSSYLISKVDKATDCIHEALELRSSEEFRTCRALLQNLSHLTQPQRYEEVNSILRSLDSAWAKLLSRYSISTSNGLQASISLGVTGPSLSFSGKLREVIYRKQNRPFVRLFRNIAEDMLNVERMGGLYEKLTASVRRHKDATYTDVSVTSKFMQNRDNGYSRPAELGKSDI